MYILALLKVNSAERMLAIRKQVSEDNTQRENLKQNVEISNVLVKNHVNLHEMKIVCLHQTLAINSLD